MKTLASFFTTVLTGTLAFAAPVDFTKEVQPILNQACVNCHGPAKAKSGIRLDSLAAVNQSGSVVVGNSAKSTLFQCLTASDGTPQMPPKGRLTAPQMATIKAWIDQGAKADPKAAADGVAKANPNPVAGKPNPKPNPIPGNVRPPVVGNKELAEKQLERQKELAEQQFERQKEMIEKLPERQRELAEKQLERQKEMLERQREQLKKQRERN